MSDVARDRTVRRSSRRLACIALATLLPTVVMARSAVVDGVIDPGNSPGCVVDQGNVVLNPGATLRIEIAGPVPCTEHDRYTVQQSLSINGARLVLLLLDGYLPAAGMTFYVLDWGSLSGGFGTLDLGGAALPAGYTWDTSRLLVDGSVVVLGPAEAVTVPVPAWATTLLGAALAGAAGAGRRGSRKPGK